MRHRTPEEQSRLMKQFNRVEFLLAEIDRLRLSDPGESEASREAFCLSTLSGILPPMCEAGGLRVESVIRIMDVIIQINEEIVATRKLQLARHNAS